MTETVTPFYEEEEQLTLDFENPLTSAVREFREVFGASEDPELWANLIREEEKEVADALAAFIKEAVDFDWVIEGYVQVGGDLSALGDMKLPMWVQDMILSIPPEIFLQAVARVRASNLSKLGEDGKPVRREDGKILKGPNYRPADLSDLTIIKE